MGKARISSFIVDLKLTPDNQVVILEMGRAWASSAFRGHDRISNGTLALRDKIGGYYKSFGVPITQIGEHDKGLFPVIGTQYKYVTDFKPDNKQPFTPDAPAPSAIKDHRALLLRFKTEDSNYFDRIKQALNPAITVDDCGPLLACMFDKSIFAKLIAEKAPEITPKQYVVPVDDRMTAHWPRFRDHDPFWSAPLVLKCPNALNGDEVKIIQNENGAESYDDLDRAVGNMTGLQKDFLLVVQEVVRGRRVKHPQKPGLYDPTIRIAVTAIHENDKTHLECHDIAYNKFPLKPCNTHNEDVEEESLKSEPKQKLFLLGSCLSLNPNDARP